MKKHISHLQEILKDGNEDRKTNPWIALFMYHSFITYDHDEKKHNFLKHPKVDYLILI